MAFNTDYPHTLVCSNDTLDFYVVRYRANDWYTYAVRKGTLERVTMAGFGTKKQATHCANTWQGWMK